MSTKWQSPSNAPYGKTLIVALQVYHRAMDIWEVLVTTGTKDNSKGTVEWIIEDYLECDIVIIAWQHLPDFPDEESNN